MRIEASLDREHLFSHYLAYYRSKSYQSRRKAHKLLTNAASVALGTLIGTTLAFSCFYEIKYIPRKEALSNYANRHGYTDSSNSTDMFMYAPNLRCIVIFSGETDKPSRYLKSVKDTYGPKCDLTLYYTTSSRLKERFQDEINIYSVKSFESGPQSFNFWIAVLKHAATVANDTAYDWTVVVDERTYLVPENAKRFAALNRPDPYPSRIISGRTVRSYSIMSYLFPLFATDYYDTHAGVLLSRGGVEALISHQADRQCSGLFFPSDVGSAMYSCIKTLDFDQLADGDPEGGYYFLPEGPRELIPNSGLYGKQTNTGFVSATLFGAHQNSEQCCSDRAITFGQVHYRELRMLWYLLYKLKKYGLNQIDYD